jgi:ubiquinone/menaquinone biosynthesis C-methylase UbiE
MKNNLEQNNEDLKQESKNWWSAHSQDYTEAGEIPHQGVPSDMNDEQFLEYLEKIDINFGLDGYFAQKRGSPLFSSLIPKNLSGKKVLEVGCGLGAHTEMLCKNGADVTSIDLSDTSIEVTRRRLKLKGYWADVRQADAEKLPFENEYFDYIWSWGVIHHSPNTLACANEMNRVLKPGGGIGIMLYNRHSFYNWFNVIFRYGFLKGELLTKSIQELHNRYTDGKEEQGAPLSKYYTKRYIKEVLFPNFSIYSQKAFEQKRVLSFIIPAKHRRKFERFISDSFYTFLWSKFGFLLFSQGIKKQISD